MTRRHQALTLQQASAESPTLAALFARARASQACLQVVLPTLPLEMRAAIQAGPIEEGSWCILVRNSAVGSKLRQLSPLLVSKLQAQGWDVKALRIKVQGRT